MIWWLAFEKKPFHFWQKIWIQVTVILLQLYLDKTPWFLNSSSGQFLNSMYLWRHKLTQFWGTIIAEKWQLFFLSGTLSLHDIHCVTVDQISNAYLYLRIFRGSQMDDTFNLFSCFPISWGDIIWNWTEIYKNT